MNTQELKQFVQSSIRESLSVSLAYFYAPPLSAQKAKS